MQHCRVDGGSCRTCNWRQGTLFPLCSVAVQAPPNSPASGLSPVFCLLCGAFCYADGLQRLLAAAPITCSPALPTQPTTNLPHRPLGDTCISFTHQHLDKASLALQRAINRPSPAQTLLSLRDCLRPARHAEASRRLLSLARRPPPPHCARLHRTALHRTAPHHTPHQTPRTAPRVGRPPLTIHPTSLPPHPWPELRFPSRTREPELFTAR